MAFPKSSPATHVAATPPAGVTAAPGRFRTEVASLAFLSWAALSGGEAWAQRYGSPHSGAAAVGGSGGGDGFLTSPIFIMVVIAALFAIVYYAMRAVFALLRWLISLRG